MAISDPGSHPRSRRRAAAYVRMSTDHQELSIGFQMSYSSPKPWRGFNAM